MICQNCKKEVDDDLVFCTECGSRLHETVSSAKTVVIPEPMVTQAEAEKPNSTLKIATIIVGIIAFFAVLGVGALLVFNPFSPKPVSQNSTPKPSRTPTPKPANQNKTANIPVNNSNTNTDWTNVNSNNSANQNTEKELPKTKKVILDERVNVDADAHVAFPFKVTEDVKIVGEVEILNGEQYEGFVFLQEIYDEHSVDSTYKIFSFDSNQGKSAELEQFLPKGDYVLVFANNDGQGVSVKTKFTQIFSNF